MSADLDKLIRILVAEREDGCRNRVVIGGLESFLALWVREAGEQTEPARQSLVAEVTSRLQGYAQKPITERVTAVRETLQAVQTDSQEQVEEKQRGARPGQAQKKERRRPEQSALSLKSPVTAVKGMGTARARRLERLGVYTIEDLIYFFPRRYDDFSRLRTIDQLQYGEEVTIVGIIQEAINQTTRKGIHLTRVGIYDGTGTIEAVWFNQPYLVRQLRSGRRIVVSGRVDQYLGRLTFQSPQWEPWKDKLVHTGRLVPVYALTEGLSGRHLRSLIQSVVEHWAPQMSDCLPSSLRQAYDLADVSTEIGRAHV